MGSVSPADLRGMLRADAVGLGLGVLLVVAALFTLGFSVGNRRRAVTLIWVGTFGLLYGLRLLARTPTFRLYFELPPIVWDHLAAAITYIVPIPILLFVRAFVPTSRRFSTIAAVGVAAFAAYAVAADFILHRPNSAGTANNVIAIALLGALIGLFFRPGLPPSRDVRTARIGVVAVSLAALVDNLRGMKALAFRGPDLEPFGFTVLAGCLGAVAVRRILGDARRLVAIDRELSIAREIQSSILPREMPRLDAATLAARYQPMTAVAGDFYDFVQIDRHRLGVLVADVCGHGVPAALIASMVKIALASQHARADRPAALLAGMNDALCGQLAGQYVTAAYMCLDTRSGVVRYAAAGHPPMLRLVRRTLDVEEVEKNGLPLGFFPAAAYEEVEVPLEPGDRLLLYTDGLTEAANAIDEMFGAERVKEAVAASAGISADAAAARVLDTMNAWSGQPPRDDLTIVVVDWTANP